MATREREAWLTLARGRARAARPSDRGTNPRGIPYALFLENVEDYVTTREDVEPTLRSFQEMIS
jgi:hypothetical protein